MAGDGGTPGKSQLKVKERAEDYAALRKAAKQGGRTKATVARPKANRRKKSNHKYFGLLRIASYYGRLKGSDDDMANRAELPKIKDKLIPTHNPTHIS